jgi:transposase
MCRESLARSGLWSRHASNSRRTGPAAGECLEDFIAEDNPFRVIDAFVGELDLARLGFEGAEPAATGRPSYIRPVS